MGEVCGDNCFEVIAKAKKDLLESTNIGTRQDEMAVLDNILLRCWQMGWLDRYTGVCGAYDGIPLERYKLSEGEVIVARYNYGEVPRDVINKQHKLLQEVFGDDKIISIPQNTLLERMSKGQLKELFDYLQDNLIKSEK